MIKQLANVFLNSLFSVMALKPIVNQTTSNPNNYNNIFVLGDSLSDTGAFAQYQGHFERKLVFDPTCSPKPRFRPPMSNASDCFKFVPYWKAKNLALPFYENSFSNGPVAVQCLANLLGISNFTSASYDSDKFDNFGYNYATGTAKILTSDELVTFEVRSRIVASVLDSDRYNLANQVIKLKRHHQIINERDLLVINIGSNDLLEIVYALEIFAGQLPRRVMVQRLNDALDSLFRQVEDLIVYGFKRIVVSNLPDLSRTPVFNDNETGKEFAKEFINKYNTSFNEKFTTLLENRQFKNKVKKFDMHQAFNETLDNYELNNKITSIAAVDVSWALNFVLNDNFTPYYIGFANEENLDNYAFFDDLHPTGLFHKAVSQKLYEVVSTPWQT